jgi:hypothetical protein
MSTLPNAILSARPPSSSVSTLALPPVRALGGAAVIAAANARAPTQPLPNAIASVQKRAPPSPIAPPSRGRPDKAERAKQERRDMNERIAAFAETKPSRRDVREFFNNRIAELKDD